jgi:glycosyltransferase involved in cell wall biosynthesis
MLDVLSRAYLARTGGRVAPVRPTGRIAYVSVVIPCYNYGRYLRQCVESVTENQPNIALEVIIVDDASTDNSLDQARALQDEYECVKVIAHESNKGHIATYNEGLWAATGEFVVLLSADDLVTPGSLTRAAALLLAEDTVGMVYGSAIHFSGDIPKSRLDGKAWIIWSGVEWLRNRCVSGYNVVASPEVMMRSSVLRAIGGYRPDLPHAGDFEMWVRASAVSDVGFLAGVDQAYYRHHGVNMNSQIFASGSPRGQLIDLKQRWQSFEAVFHGVGAQLAEADLLFHTARATIASQALRLACYAYARGFRDFPIDDLVAFAYEVCPGIGQMTAGRALARRQRLGMLPLPLHPLWAPSAIAWRLEEVGRRFRRRQFGI